MAKTFQTFNIPLFFFSNWVSVRISIIHNYDNDFKYIKCSMNSFEQDIVSGRKLTMHWTFSSLAIVDVLANTKGWTQNPLKYKLNIDHNTNVSILPFFLFLFLNRTRTLRTRVSRKNQLKFLRCVITFIWYIYIYILFVFYH